MKSPNKRIKDYIHTRNKDLKKTKTMMTEVLGYNIVGRLYIVVCLYKQTAGSLSYTQASRAGAKVGQDQ